MLDVDKAAFVFKTFKVPYCTFDDRNHSGREVKMGFSPSGRYFSKTGEFELTLKFITHDIEDNDKVIFDLIAIAIFKFDNLISHKDIPTFFYQNAIAIMFPYLRAFVSTLTLQSNTKLLQLELMNLSSLEKPLMDNTIKI